MADRRNGEPQVLGDILRDAARADLEPGSQTPLSILLQSVPEVGLPAPAPAVDKGGDR